VAARRLRRNLNLSHPADHGSPGQAAGLRHRSDSAKANGFGLGGRDQTARALVQNAREQLELARQTFGVWHGCQYKTFRLKMFYLFCDRPLVAG
jgi:hypothetical protein